MAESVKLVLGLSLILLFPSLALMAGLSSESTINSIPGGFDAWLYVEHGLPSNPERYTSVDLEEFNHLPTLKRVLEMGETPIDHVMMEYDVFEASRAVFYLETVKGLESRRHLDDGKVFYIFAVEVEGRYTYISIVFGESRPQMA